MDRHWTNVGGDAYQSGFLEELLEALPHPLYIVETAGATITTANRMARSEGIVAGASYFEVVQTRRADRLEERDQPCLLEIVRKTRRATAVEYQFAMESGETRFMRVHGYPVLSAEGSVDHIIEYCLDLTDHKVAEQALRESENRHQDLFTMARLMADNVPDMLWAKDLRGRYLAVNRALCEDILGTEDTDEPIGKTDQFFAKRERAKDPDNPDWYTLGEVCTDSDEIVLRERKSQQFDEFGMVRGKLRWFDVRKAPLFGNQGQLIGTVGSARDVTRERELDEERRRLQMAIEQAEMGLVILSVDGVAVYANPAYGWITGHSPEETIGRDVEFFSKYYEEPGILDEIMETVVSGKSWRGRVRKTHKDGRKYVQGQTVAPVRGPDGRISNVVVYLRDVTSRVGLEARYLQAQKLESLGQLAGGIAHDFNNLLGAVRAYAEVMQLELGPDSAFQEQLGDILGATESGARLTRQLLVFAHRRPGVQRLLDLNRLVSEFEGMLRQLIGEHIILVTRLGRGLPPVLADPSQIEQVLVNLVVNARDAMPRGGSLTIETSTMDALKDDEAAPETGCWVVLAVHDTGVGMDQEIQEHIFEPFFTTKEVGKGTGLGLSTCFGIVNQAGGHMVVDSGPGTGTSMRVFLPPAAGEALPQAEQKVSRDMPGGTETILFVEDETKLLRAVSKALRTLGYRVIEAENGVQALELWHAKAGRIDLLLTDEVMPYMAGSELSRRLRKLDPELKVIVVSGYLHETSETPADVPPDTVIVHKPFPLQTIADTIRQVFDGGTGQSQEAP